MPGVRLPVLFFYFEMVFSVAYFLVILKFAMMSMFEQGYTGNFKLKRLSILKITLRESKYVNLKRGGGGEGGMLVWLILYQHFSSGI